MDSRNKRSDKNSELYRAITALDSLDDCYDFLVDLCTQPELKAMEQRYEVARMLDRGMIYSDILAETSASSATISRVNRTCKYKIECHVIDCSWRNVNTKNINLAFKKYCDMVISQFNPEEEAKLIAGYYKDMTASKPYIQWFNEYVQKKDDADFILDMESSIRDWVNICMAREAAIRKQNEELGLEPGDADYVQPENEAKMLRYIVGQYASALMSLKNVYDIAAKYTEETFL